MIDRSLTVAIIGAGIGGLTAAIALQRAGFRPIVYEQATQLGDVGAGISVTPNATKALESLGLGLALAQLAQSPPHQIVRDGLTDAPLLHIDRSDSRSRYGAAYYLMHRADLHAIMVAAVNAHDPATIRTGHALLSITPAADHAVLHFAGQAAVSAAITIAADGARSLVRSQVFGDQGASFTGHIAWRLLVPAAAAPTAARAPGSIVWTGTDRSFVRYPVRGGQLINCVGLTRSGGWRGEGWSQRLPVAQMAAEYAGWVPHVTDLIAAAPASMVGSWGLFSRPLAARIIAGSIALIGDAAHPMLPFMGQGAAMAMEDGVVLGRCFQVAATSAEALLRYQAARLARCHFIQAESAAGADRLQIGTPAKRRFDRNEDSLGIFAYDPASVPV